MYFYKLTCISVYIPNCVLTCLIIFINRYSYTSVFIIIYNYNSIVLFIYLILVINLYIYILNCVILLCITT